MSLEGGQPKNMKIPFNPIYKATKHIKNAIFSSLIITSNRYIPWAEQDTLPWILFLRNPFIQLIFKTVVFTI